MGKGQMMKLAGFTVVACAVILGHVAFSAADDMAAEPKTLFGDYLKEKGIEIEPSATLDFYDKYVWRGGYLDKDPVVQPGISFSSYGLTVGYWGSLPMGTASDTLNSSESDYYLSYSYTLKPVTLTAGHTWYAFSGSNTESKEFYFTVAADTFLSPSVSFFHDYDEGKKSYGNGNYWALSIAHNLPLLDEPNISLDLAATFGYIDEQWLAGQGSHLTPTVGINIPLTANLTIVPTLGYNVPMGDLSDSSIGNQRSKVFGGIKSSFSF